jgi:hypothetical protein
MACAFAEQDRAIWSHEGSPTSLTVRLAAAMIMAVSAWMGERIMSEPHGGSYGRSCAHFNTPWQPPVAITP